MSATPLIPGQPTLETDRLILRGFAAEDLAPYMAFYADEAARFVGGPTGEADAWRRFAGIVGHLPIRGYAPFTWVLRETGAWVGFGGPWYPAGKPDRELMWAMSPAFHGQGLAFEAASVLRGHVRRDLGWRTAISLIEPENTPSARLATRLGAVLEDGAWYDAADRRHAVYRHDLTRDMPVEAQSPTISPG